MCHELSIIVFIIRFIWSDIIYFHDTQNKCIFKFNVGHNKKVV